MMNKRKRRMMKLITMMRRIL